MQINNFLIHSKPIALAISIGNWISWKFLAATTAIFSYAMLSDFLSGHFTGTSFYIALFIGIGMVYGIIDAGLGVLLKWAFQIKGKMMNKHEKAFTNLIILLIIFKVVATMTSSIWAAPEMADSITDNQGEKKAISILLATDSVQNNALSFANQRLQELQATEAQRVEAAKEEGKVIVAEAVALGNKWQRDSYKKIGFAWLQNPNNPDKSDHQYAQRIQEAQNQAAQMVQDARNAALVAQENVNTLSNDPTYISTSTLLTDVAKREGMEYTEKKARRTGYFWLFDVLATAMGLFCSYLLSLREKAGGKPIKSKNIPAILGKWMELKYDSFLEFLESILGVDIDGNGEVGTVGKTVVAPTGLHPETTATALAVAQDETMKQIGFKIPETTGKHLLYGKKGKSKHRAATTKTDATKMSDRYLKQRAKQTYLRSLTQDDPTTPKDRFDEFKVELENRNFKVILKENDLEIIPPEP